MSSDRPSYGDLHLTTLTNEERAALQALGNWHGFACKGLGAVCVLSGPGSDEWDSAIPFFVWACTLEGRMKAAGLTQQTCTSLETLGLVERAPADFYKLLRGTWQAGERTLALDFEQLGEAHAQQTVHVDGAKVFASHGRVGVKANDCSTLWRLTGDGLKTLRESQPKAPKTKLSDTASKVAAYIRKHPGKTAATIAEDCGIELATLCRHTLPTLKQHGFYNDRPGYFPPKATVKP